MTVSVRDSKDDYGASDTATDDSITVTITVNGVDETPEVMGPDSIDYAENGAGEVTRYTAFDPETGNITWSWDGDDKDIFHLDANGALTFITTPDYENPKDTGGDNVYQITVEASDANNTGSLPASITVTNVDEDGTVTLSSDRPQTGTALTATLSDLDGTVRRHHVGMGKLSGWEHGLDRRQRSRQHTNDIQLYAGGWRPGQVPAGHRNLHRPGRFGQERGCNGGQSDEQRAGLLLEHRRPFSGRGRLNRLQHRHPGYRHRRRHPDLHARRDRRGILQNC